MPPSRAPGAPPAARWIRRKAEAAARLEAARAGLAELSQRVSVPTKNLVTPRSGTRCAGTGNQSTTSWPLDDFLRETQVRPWQRELVAPALAAPRGSTTGDT